MLTDALPVDQNGITLGTNIWKFFVKTVYLFFSNQIKEKHLEKQLVNDIEIYPQTKIIKMLLLLLPALAKDETR